MEGPARRAVQGLTLTEVNYDSAVEILKERFHKSQQIISAHMDELMEERLFANSEQFELVLQPVKINALQAE